MKRKHNKTKGHREENGRKGHRKIKDRARMERRMKEMT